MTTSLAFDFHARQLWDHVPVEYPPARELADRHYPRQTVGAKGILAGGWRFLLWHQGEPRSSRHPDRRFAAWGVVRNRFRKRWRWRNSFFRNESTTLSSELIRDATRVTYEMWALRYKGLPPERLTSTRRARAAARNIPRATVTSWPDGSTSTTSSPVTGRPARAVYAAPIPVYAEDARSELVIA